MFVYLCRLIACLLWVWSHVCVHAIAFDMFGVWGLFLVVDLCYCVVNCVCVCCCLRVFIRHLYGHCVYMLCVCVYGVVFDVCVCGVVLIVGLFMCVCLCLCLCLCVSVCV